MERSEFFKRTQRALWHFENGGFKEEDIVIHKSMKYYPCGCFITWKDGEWTNMALLHDAHANSVSWVPLSEVMG